MNKYKFVFGLVLVILLNSFNALSQPQNSRKEMEALSAKPAVVRICGGFRGILETSNEKEKIGQVSCGSGFFLNSDGFIATNAHVTKFVNETQGATESEVEQEVLKIIIRKIAEKNNTDPEKVARNIKLSNFKYVHHVFLPTCGESLPFVIKKFGKPDGRGEDVAIIKVETKNAPSIKIATDSNQVRLQDEVTIVGYPGAADQDTTCDSYHQASFSRGIVSAKKSDENGNPILQLDANASWGNSGGPVLNNQGEVIGLATSIGLANNELPVGISFIVPSTKLQEFIKDAGTTNAEGSTNRIFQEGLQLYENNCYDSAIKKFEETKQLFPRHSEVEKLIRDSREKITANQSKWELSCSSSDPRNFNVPSWLWIVGGGAIFCTVIFLILKSRGVNSI